MVINFDWTNKTNGNDDVMAEDVNSMADAIQKIITALNGIETTDTEQEKQISTIRTSLEEILSTNSTQDAQIENILQQLENLPTGNIDDIIEDINKLNKKTDNIINNINEVNGKVDSNYADIRNDIGFMADVEFRSESVTKMADALNYLYENKVNFSDIIIDLGGVNIGTDSACNGYGAALGYGTNTIDGLAGGEHAYTDYGLAGGCGAYSTDGFAGGFGSKTGSGVAAGHEAKTIDSDKKPIDAIQLGTGTNNTPKTMQVYGKRIVEADGSLTDVGVLSDLLTEVKSSVVEAINDLVNVKEDVTSIKYFSSVTDAELEPAYNTEVRYRELATLNITVPEEPEDDYISSIVFTSGETATNLVYPETIQMSGEGCIDGVFVPAANKRYTVILSYDGAYISGVVGGVSI